MRKKILLLAAMVVASSTTIDAQRRFPFFWKKKKAKTEQITPAKKESEYDKLFKKKHEIAKGLITLHLLLQSGVSGIEDSRIVYPSERWQYR